MMKGTLKFFERDFCVSDAYLAKLEVQSLLGRGIDKTSEDFKIFYVNELSYDEFVLLLKRTSHFHHINNVLTDYSQLCDVNLFGKWNTYLTHGIYPYKGKFHPRMVRALINICNVQPGETILDPLLGSGTTGVEAQILGINFIGFDILPWCKIIASAKTQGLQHIEDIKKLKPIIINEVNKYEGNFERFPFHQFINDITENSVVKHFYQTVRLTTISDISRRHRIPIKAFYRNLNNMIETLEKSNEVITALNLKLGNVRVEVADARAMPVDDNSIDCVITSPPYAAAIDYLANDKHTIEDLGLDSQQLQSNFIGLRGKNDERIRLYEEDLYQIFKELRRVVKPNKHVVIVIGNAKYKTKRLDTIGFTVSIMNSLGFRTMYNIHKNFMGNQGTTIIENVLIFKKEG